MYNLIASIWIRFLRMGLQLNMTGTLNMPWHRRDRLRCCTCWHRAGWERSLRVPNWCPMYCERSRSRFRWERPIRRWRRRDSRLFHHRPDRCTRRPYVKNVCLLCYIINQLGKSISNLNRQITHNSKRSWRPSWQLQLDRISAGQLAWPGHFESPRNWTCTLGLRLRKYLICKSLSRKYRKCSNRWNNIKQGKCRALWDKEMLMPIITLAV